MPSTAQANQQADGIPSLFPESEAKHGENPARFLVEDIRIDSGDGTSGQLITARIRGLETVALCRFWVAVERRLAADEGREPRDRVIAAIKRREQDLEGDGEGNASTEMDPGERRERNELLAEECPEAVESQVVILDEDGNERERSQFRSKRKVAAR